MDRDAQIPHRLDRLASCAAVELSADLKRNRG
jgi:hypothetical protein